MLRLPANVTVGDPVSVGIRPEDVQIGIGEVTLEGHAAAVERLGNESFIYLDLPGGSEFAVHSGGDVAASVGSKIQIGLSSARCHVFDRNGQALPASS